jgi:hypothetical protein
VGGKRTGLSIRPYTGGSMQDLGYELRRIPLPKLFGNSG